MLDELLAEGFNHHAAEPDRVAKELEAADLDGAGAATLVEFLRVGNHTIGEHLRDWSRARRLAERALDGRTPTNETAKAWAHLSVARLLDSDPAAALTAELAFIGARGGDVAPPMIEARFMLVAALIGCGRATEAASVYDAALGLAEALGDAAPHRPVAVASNNLASQILEQPTRTPEEEALMIRASEAAHAFWLKCGDWKNDERARHLKALVANVRRRPEEALGHVKDALAIIDANDGEAPIDATFLHLTAAHAHKLSGALAAERRELAISDAAAASWDDPDLKAWYAEERARVFGA